MVENKGSFELSEKIERLKDEAYRDSLTGLLNRGAAEIYIENAIAQIQEGENSMMMIVDLDNFKMVNDTLGHQTGDLVLCRAGEILSGLFRPGDIVARLGGDEYMVFLWGNVTKNLAERKGKEICGSLQLTVGDSQQVSISSSVGIFFSDKTAVSFREMYHKADMALYQAKKGGKSQYVIYDNSGSSTVGLPETETEPAPVSTITKADRETEHTGNSIVIIDSPQNARIIYADAAFGSMLGLSDQKIEGKTLTDHMHPDDVPIFRMIIENLIENKGSSVQIRLRSPMGGWNYQRVNAVLIEYDKTKCILLNLYNVLMEEKKASGRKRKRIVRGGADENKWEVDLATKQFKFYGSNQFFMPIQAENCAFPYDLVSTGWIAPESVGRFMKFATGIFAGRIKGYGNFLVRSGNGWDYEWATFSYRTQGDSQGIPYQVTGQILPLNTEAQEDKRPFSRKNSIPVPVIDGLIVKLDANVTDDIVTKIWIEGSFREREYDNKKIFSFIINEARRIYNRRDKVNFTIFFSRENLLRLYQRNCYWMFMEYRRVDSGGYIEWVCLAMNLYRRTLDEEIRVRISIHNCDDRRIWECHSSQEDIRDKTTNLYSLAAVKEMLRGLRTEATEEICGAALIKICGLHQLTRGNHQKLKSIEEYVVSMLSYTLGTGCMATKVDAEHYLFLFPDSYSSSHLNRTLEMAFNYSKLLLSEMMPVNSLRFLAAVVCTPLKEAEFDSLLSSCRFLTEPVNTIKEDRIILQREKDAAAVILPADFEKKITVIETEEHALSFEEQKVFSDCLSDMLLASSADKALEQLFGRLGNYYQADRIYMISMENKNRDLEVSCEWRLPHLEMISMSLSRSNMDKLQLLTRCFIEKKPLHYTARALGQDDGGEEKQWDYCIFPVRFSEQAYAVTDFLCLENPKKREETYALISQLIPYIKNQKTKLPLQTEGISSGSKSRLEDIPNLFAYVRGIPAFLSQKYISMAVYLAKVSRLSILNSHHGFAYGRSILLYIAETFADALGEKYLYRTWDNEFIALLPNVSKEAAEEKFKRLKMAFEKRYDEYVLVNYRWTKASFTSRELMDMPKAGIRGSIIDVEKYLKSYTSETSDVKLDKWNFTVYIQPVFNVKSGHLVGAELLVRGINEKGEIVQPGRFLRQMEREHRMKQMDLFVLEQALVILDSWKEQGIKDIPLSVNFSRDTMLDPTILASFLAIRSRYPGLGYCRLGIEISQSIGEEYYHRLSSVMEQLREFGAEFIADDVGVDRNHMDILNQLRFETVKIDNLLVADMEFSDSARETVRSIVNSCMNRKANCVAEGLETKEQLEILRKLGCRYAQGYYYEKPVTLEEFNSKYMK